MVPFTWHIVAETNINLFRLGVPNSGAELAVSRVCAFEVGVAAC